MNVKIEKKSDGRFYVRETLLEATYFRFNDLKEAVERASGMYDPRVDTYSEYDSTGLHISACRVATDVEEGLYLAREKQILEDSRERDLALFRRLKALFEGK